MSKWTDGEVYIIEEEQSNEFHEIGYGGEVVKITEEHINALRNGKCVAWSDGEYTHILYLEGMVKND